MYRYLFVCTVPKVYLSCMSFGRVVTVIVNIRKPTMVVLLKRNANKKVLWKK